MKPLQLPWKGRDVPCATLDVLRVCNIRCQYCYNIRGAKIKPLDAVLKELDELTRLRNLQSIIISGGEPLLHPNLPDILRAVRVKGLRSLLLTNGVLLDEAMTQTLRDAGADIVALHIQEGQERPDLSNNTSPDEIRRLRDEKAALLVRHGLTPGLSITIELEEPEPIRHLLEYFNNSPHYGYLLLCAAFQHGALKFYRKEDRDCGRFAPNTLAVVLRENGFLPLVWLSAVHDPNVAQWMAFHSLQRRKDGKPRGIRPLRASLLEIASLRLARALTGRHAFVMRTKPWLSITRQLLNALSGGGLCGAWFLIKALLYGEHIMDKHIVLEMPPVPKPEGGTTCCHDCPNATLRNGKLVALCQADMD